MLSSELVANSLMNRTEDRRIAALRSVTSEQQADLGQFFTPERAARLVASLPTLPREGRLRILDPGAGAGALLAALSARIFSERPGLAIEIVAVEVDAGVEPYLKETLEDVVESGRQIGTKVDHILIRGDYLENRPGVSDLLYGSEPFDIVIMNPPYRKLGATSAHRRMLNKLGVDCPNLYAAFLAMGAMGLRDGGQLVAITPRSFANGPYFDEFRKFLLDRVALRRIHVFESRSTVFSDTGVLQENIVFTATRAGSNDNVVLSVSHGHEDDISGRQVSYSDVVKPGDPHRFIRLLVEDADTAIAETMASMPSTLTELNIKASTGRVVDFRSRECLLEEPDANSYPLIYPGNVRGGLIEWPRKIRKNQGFAIRDGYKDEKLLLPQGYYVVVKRFSAKEERRRVVAAVWDPSRIPGPVAFENHLNVFHANGIGLPRDIAVGLSYWLNSSVVDRFFRTFSGHTQVNATDLRSLRYPSLENLSEWGRSLQIELPSQEEIDQKIALLL